MAPWRWNLTRGRILDAAFHDRQRRSESVRCISCWRLTMSENNANYAVSTDLVAAYSICKRKAYLLLRGEHGDAPHGLVQILDDHAAVALDVFLKSMQETGLSVQQYPHNDQSGDADVLARVSLLANEVEATIDALVRLTPTSSRTQPRYEPYLVIGRHTVTMADKIRLAFFGHVLSETHCYLPQTGVIVNLEGSAQRIQLTKLMNDVAQTVDVLKTWKASLPSDPPIVSLNDHCPLCPFRKLCLEQAEKDDSLTLLDRMTPKLMRKYHQKGIFTVNQLSYLFKPRRRRKDGKQRAMGFKLELQALALRTGKIYVHQAPFIPASPTEIFLDMEGVPDRGTTYLIGAVISKNGQEDCLSFWADSMDDEPRILEMLVQLADKYPDVPIYHYGSYEPRALDRIAKRHNLNCAVIKSRMVNINTFIFGRVYFPSRSNSLKPLGQLVGATWTSPHGSGLQSIVWRLQWEALKAPELKQRLLTYNLEDCRALRALVMELRNIGQAADTRADVDFADAPKQNTTASGRQIHECLERMLKSAHAEYRKNRIEIGPPQESVATGQKKRGAPKGHQGHRRIIPAKVSREVRVRRPLTCPRSKCPTGQMLEASDEVSEHIVIDLVFSQSGCRKIITKYTGNMGFCPRCKTTYAPPAIRRLKGRLFGHNLRAWAVYQRITLRLPYRVVSQVIYDLFREQVSVGSIVAFITDLARYYASTAKAMLQAILTSPFIHVDETKLNIQGVQHYVWVLTNGVQVIFRLTETREATLIQEMLNGYSGVLISDFYGGYDSCNCRQQKCLVHLIRDLNDDLWKHPYDAEFEGFVGAFKNLLVPIMNDVEKYGLKQFHFNKRKNSVDRFYRDAIDGRTYKSELTQKYQKRFSRYRESLFRFLQDDGIPWNNNAAERASRHLAVQRKISGSFFKQVAEDYLRLLAVAQTCRFQEKSFLGFLLSKGKSIDQFKERRRPKVTRLVGGERKGDGDCVTRNTFDDEGPEEESVGVRE